MALPIIESYALPSADELPNNRVTWQLKPHRAALLIHDMQAYFTAAFAGKTPLMPLLEHIRQLRQRCDELQIPVIYSAQPAAQTPEQRGLLQDFWGTGIVEVQQAQIVDQLAPRQHDQVLTKWRYSAFQRTNLRELLREQGRDQLIICGIYGHIGCLMTAGEAFMQDIQPFVVADGIADFSRDQHLQTLAYIAQRCGIVADTAQILTTLVAPSLTLEIMRTVIAQQLGEPIEAIHDDVNLLDLGLDSIRLMSLVEQWRQAGVELDFVELAEQPTLAAWWQFTQTTPHEVHVNG